MPKYVRRPRAEYRPRTNSKAPSVARIRGVCDICPNPIEIGQQVQRRNGVQMHATCAGKE